ncbi:hypothetical protein KC19_VG322200 [Ceratodon purpureus]|uniref:Reverse transcriptase zinc-binding domain-containing protein n=1 Tax=Ceratodon purpureus TaxID=3225 RepID=A0A8T0HVM4_CERPU|nr:hypothetical protein KC19_VG322200 [Ceratodon purpureus]
MNAHLREVPPSNDAEVLQIQLWAELGTSHHSIGPGTWIAGYGPEPQNEPIFAVQACRTWRPGDSSQMERFTTLPSGYPIFHVGQQSRMLIPAKGADAFDQIRNWTGKTAVARIVLVEKSKSKQSFAYYGKVGDLQDFDPVLWKWRNGEPFTLYRAKIGKELLSNRDQLKKPIAEKWRHETNFQPKPDWKAVWSNCSKKESAFLWSVLHQAVATNTWRARFNPQASPHCPLCGLGIPETKSHRFFQCPFAKELWNFGFTILHWLTEGPKSQSPAKAYSLEQCIFGKRIRLRMMGALRAWALLRGIIVWGSWILRNDAVFEETVWSNARSRRYIWDSLLEYGRVEWDRTLKKLKFAKSPEKAQSALCEFDSTWTIFEVFCVRDGLRVSWKYASPDVPLILW